MSRLLACFLVCVGFNLVCSENALNFVMLGDWGGQGTPPYYTKAEKTIAESMGKVAAQINSQFTVAMGDNFYPLGVSNAHDSRFQTTFENVFTSSSLQKRWYVICGNHDHYGNESAEVAYTKLSPRWYMPDLYYSQVFTIPGSQSTVQMLFIDTVVLAGLTDPVKRSLPPSDPNVNDAVEEWKWIESSLNASTADWILVCGHYPVWSVAEHGPTDTLVKNLRPLLMKYNVAAYFCGHDHNIQHLKENGSTVNYFVSGAGHLTDPSKSHEHSVPSGSLKFIYDPTDILSSHGGFNSVSISSDQMVVTFYNASGEEIYTTTISKTSHPNQKR